MSYTSLYYYALVLILVVLYYILPKKIRWTVLLAGSIAFYVLLVKSIPQIIVFAFSPAVAYVSGLLTDCFDPDENSRKRKISMIIGITLTALPLVIFKAGDLITGSVLHLGKVSWIIPAGLSFYTLQLIAYIADVYKGKISSQRNPLKFLLFAMFFPQIIQGPIPRYETLGDQLYTGHDFDPDNFMSGIQRLIWGFFLKFMIADKAAVIVDTVFGNYRVYGGGYILLAAVLFSIQLYADFLACTTLSQGVAILFGIHLDNNFRHPYFSTSVKEFWTRWHISLSTWLRDYIYIPLGGNRKGKFRKYINILITFAVSGLWHGGSFHFIVWGLLHSVYQICGDISGTFLKTKKIIKDETDAVYLTLKRILTFILVTIAWIIFRADSLMISLDMIKIMITDFNPWIWIDDSIFRLGLNWREYGILGFSIFIMYFVSTKQEHGIGIRQWFSKQSLPVRWGIYLISIWLIWICGTYGFGFDSGDFIYGGF